MSNKIISSGIISVVVFILMTSFCPQYIFSEETTGLSGGIGINIDEKILKAGRMRLDYAFVPYGDLGMTHRISLGFGMLGGKKDEEEVKIEKDVEVKSTEPAKKEEEKPAEKDTGTQPKPEETK